VVGQGIGSNHHRQGQTQIQPTPKTDRERELSRETMCDGAGLFASLSQAKASIRRECARMFRRIVIGWLSHPDKVAQWFVGVVLEDFLNDNEIKALLKIFPFGTGHAVQLGTRAEGPQRCIGGAPMKTAGPLAMTMENSVIADLPAELIANLRARIARRPGRWRRRMQPRSKRKREVEGPMPASV